MNKGIYNILNLDYEFLDNIDNIRKQDLNTEVVENYNNKNLPNFRQQEEPYLTPNYNPSIPYKNKSFYGVSKPIQTEEDEIGVNQAFLNSYYGYYDYGSFNVQNQGLINQPKRTPINNIYELL
jgi:hypothetical protein